MKCVWEKNFHCLALAGCRMHRHRMKKKIHLEKHFLDFGRAWQMHFIHKNYSREYFEMRRRPCHADLDCSLQYLIVNWIFRPIHSVTPISSCNHYLSYCLVPVSCKYDWNENEHAGGCRDGSHHLTGKRFLCLESAIFFKNEHLEAIDNQQQIICNCHQDVYVACHSSHGSSLQSYSWSSSHVYALLGK